MCIFFRMRLFMLTFDILCLDYSNLCTKKKLNTLSIEYQKYPKSKNKTDAFEQKNVQMSKQPYQ